MYGNCPFIHDDFLKTFHELLAHPYLVNKTCFLLGDFNVNLFKYEDDSFVQTFMDALLTAGFLPLITKPTRMSANSATLIDNV